MTQPTLDEDRAFLQAFAAVLPGVTISEGMLPGDGPDVPVFRSLVLAQDDKLRTWFWNYDGAGVATSQRRIDMTVLGALSGTNMIALAELRALPSPEGDPYRDARRALYHGGQAETSQSWEIWPRLWLGRTPTPGEHVDHDILMRLATPLAPGVTCRRVVLDYPFEDSEEDQHQAVAVDIAESMSHMLAEQWHAGESIRVSCLAGLNRSALVLGAVLCRLGMTGEEAVAQIWWKRGKYALSNARFHRWLVEDFGPRMAKERAAKEPPA